MSPITVAVVGATGHIGVPIVKALLSKAYYPEKVNKVIVVTRDPNSESVATLKAFGASALQVSDDGLSSSVFRGIDVFVNCLGHGANLATHNAYAKAAAEAGVKVYFPSVFSSDYTLWDVKHPGFEEKAEGVSYAEEVSNGRMKVIALFNSSFLEWMISPFFGLDLKSKVFTVWGDPAKPISVTSMQDIANTIAQLSVLAAANPDSVPSHFRVAGDSRSYVEIADIFSKESGDVIEVVGAPEDYERIKAELDEKYKRQENWFAYIRLFAGSGKMHLIGLNHNEIVNPNQSLWKWKTVEDFAKETKGRPGA